MSFFERLTGTIDVEDEELEERGRGEERGSISQKEYGEEHAEDGIAELAADIYETDDEIVIQTMTAGVKPEDLDISITREMVTIEGKREGPRVEQDSYFHQELYWGRFSRKVLLPSEIEVEEAEAVEKHGLVIIKLPKIDRKKAATLKVKSQ